MLFNSFSHVKLTKGSTLFTFSVISSIFMFWGRKMNISSIYLHYVVLMGNLYLKGLDSKNSKNRQARTPLSGFPIEKPAFYL